MSSDAIEGEPSHLEAILILSPSMPTLDIEYEPISKPILNHYGLFYALSPKPPDGSRHPSRYPVHRNHQYHIEDRQEQHPWLEIIRNLDAIAIEWMDKTIDKINLGDYPSEFLDIHVESPLEVENDGDFNEQGSYFINTPSKAHMKNLLIHLVSLPLPLKRSSTPSCSLFLKFLKGWL